MGGATGPSTVDVVSPVGPPATADRPAPTVARLALAAAGVAACATIPLERFANSDWHSDDVAWQVAFRSWRPGADTLVLTENTYVLRLPLLLAADALMPSTVWQLAAVSMFLCAVAFVLVLGFVRYAVAASLGRRASTLTVAEEAVAAAVAATTLVISEPMRLVNSGLTTRNVETGLYLVVLWFGYEVWTDRRRIDGVAGVAAVVTAVALLGLNDPLFVASLALPFLAGAAVLRLAVLLGRVVRPDALDSRLDVAVLGGVAGWLAIRAGLPAIGVEQRGIGVSVASPGSLPDHLEHLVRIASMASGIDRIDGDRAWQQVTAVVFAAAMVALLAALVRRRRSLGAPVLLSLTWLVSLCGLFVFSSEGGSVAGFRYVAVGAGALAAAAAVVAVRSRSGQVAVAAVLVVALGGAVTEHAVEWGRNENAAYGELADVVDELAAQGDATGYSGYWTAHIVTFLAGSEARVLAITCDADGWPAPFVWLADLSRFEAPDAARTGSFLIVDRTVTATMCAPESLRDRFGPPDRVLPVAASDGYEVWVWDRDIGPEIAPVPPL